MNADQLWTAIDEQRRRTADLLESLDTDDWAHPSLCEGWRVRDVAAHLTMQDMTIGDALRGALRHPGGLNHVIRATACDRAEQRTPDELVAEIRATIGSRRPNVGVTPFETLLDIVVHGQDIAVPTGRTLAVPPDVAAVVATRAWDYQTTRRGRRKAQVFRTLPFTGHRLVATDIDWSAGDGPEVRGPVLALVLLMTGRPVVLPSLSGEGVESLAAR